MANWRQHHCTVMFETAERNLLLERPEAEVMREMAEAPGVRTARSGDGDHTGEPIGVPRRVPLVASVFILVVRSEVDTLSE